MELVLEAEQVLLEREEVSANVEENHENLRENVTTLFQELLEQGEVLLVDLQTLSEEVRHFLTTNNSNNSNCNSNKWQITLQTN